MKPYPFIDQRHHPILSSIAKNHQVGGDVVLAELYGLAKDIFLGNVKTKQKYFCSRMELANNLIVATATIEDSGVYVQLSGMLCEVDHMVMTTGQKFSVEAKDGTGNVASKTW